MKAVSFAILRKTKSATESQRKGEIAKTDSNSMVRARAVRKLTDQAVLGEIAKCDKEERVRADAIRTLRKLRATCMVCNAQLSRDRKIGGVMNGEDLAQLVAFGRGPLVL